MPNGGEHYEQVGFCPHCRSSAISQRRRLHRSMNWRCSSCKRVFSRPEFRQAAVYSNTRYISESQVARVETRAARRWGRRRRRRGKVRTLWLMLPIVVIGLIVAYIYFAPKLPDQFRSTTLESAILRLPLFEQMGKYEPHPAQIPPSNNPGLILPEASTSTSGNPPSQGTDGLSQAQPRSLSTHSREQSKERQENSNRSGATTADYQGTANQTKSPAEENVPKSHYIPKPTPTPTTLPTATSTLFPAVTPTPLPPPDIRHLHEKELMLDLINQARANAGLSLVTLGDNVAAQLHAEASLDNCTSSHWGVDGLKPYMRYSLAGGYQSNGENGHGSDYCITSRDNYASLGPIEEEIRAAVTGWMASPGHRKNILDKWHKKVNIGIAWDKYNLVAYQHFEGEYVQYETLPTLEDGLLLIKGRTRNGIQFRTRGDLGIQIYFDPPPTSLTPGQLARTYCYSNGIQVASLREPLTGGSFWTTDQFTYTRRPCPDPYHVPDSAPAPRSPNQAHAFWREAYQASNMAPHQVVSVPWVTSREWKARGDDFSVEADLGEVINKYGNGVYTIVVWAQAGGEDVVISEYSIFYGIEPPQTYLLGSNKSH